MASNAADLELLVNDVAYRGFERCTITRAFDQLADEVAITMPDLWVEQRGTLAFPFEEGDPFELWVDGEIWVQGIITSLPLGYGPEGLTAEIQGMSWAVNLTTSSHLNPRVWRDATLDRIVRDVVGPYGLTVSVQPGLDLGEPFRRFTAGIGETSFEVCRRAALKRGVWITSDIESNIVITAAGADRIGHVIVGPRVPGRQLNVKTGRREATFLDRHDEIIVVGQSGEHSDWSGDQATYGYASAKDYGVDIFRPLVLHEPSESGAKKLQRRADFEVRTRVGRSRRLQYVVQGHLADENPAGPVVWLPNRLVQVVDKLLDVEDELLIERVQTDFANGGEGTLTTLDLVAPYAYDLLAPPPKKRQQSRGRKGKFVASWG